jgi:hypothetical protein
MNEIDLLRKYRDDVPPADPAMLEQTRALLTTPTPVRRTAKRRTLAIAGVAATVAVGLVAADVITKSSPGVDAAASQLLGNAADLTVSKPDPTIPAGSYRYVKQRLFQLSSAGMEPHLVELREHNQMEWWVPSSQAPPWIARYTYRETVEFPSKSDEAYARQHYPGVFKPVTDAFTSPCGNPDGLWMVKNPDESIEGPFGGSLNGGGCKGDWRQPTAEFLAGLSRDPAELLRTLHDNLPEGNPDADAWSFEQIGSVLASGIVPSDLRATLYRTAQRIPGVRLVDGVVNLDGATGRAVTRTTDGYRIDLIIDPTTGHFIGRRTVTPTGQITDWTSLTSHLTTTPPPKP